MVPDEPMVHTRRVADALREGVTPDRLRGGGFVHPQHGLVRPAGIELARPVARMDEAVALMTEGCVLGGWAARWTRGGKMCDGLDRQLRPRDVLIHCRPGARLRPRPGVRPYQGQLLPGEFGRVDGLDVATLARATFDEMLFATSLRETVVALDMGISTTLEQSRVELAAIRAIVLRHGKLKGIVRIRQSLGYASSRSASPWETRTRLLAGIDAGIADWEVNAPIFDLHEHLLGIADLLHVSSGLVLESDGSGHRKEGRHNDDNEREEWMEHHGLTVVRVGAAQHADRPRVARRIRAAYDDACRRRLGAWTLDKPAWWWRWSRGRRWD